MQQFLNNCTKVEKTIGEIYRHLAMVESYDENLRRAFRRLAADEEDHARQLAMALEQQAVLIPTMAGELVFRYLDQARDALEAVRRAPPAQPAAVRLAVWLEGDFRKVHLNLATLFQGSGQEKIFGLLARKDEEHLATIRPFLRSAA